MEEKKRNPRRGRRMRPAISRESGAGNPAYPRAVAMEHNDQMGSWDQWTGRPYGALSMWVQRTRK